MVVGNAGGGKSTLARRIAIAGDLPLVEVDALLWRTGWEPVPDEVYDRAHATAVAADRWVIEGLGRKPSIAGRCERATEIVLVDMPLWMHFWLAAERQQLWRAGTLPHPPAGMPDPPPTRALFQTIAAVDTGWMPDIRAKVDRAEGRGVSVTRLRDLDDLDRFAAELGPAPSPRVASQAPWCTSAPLPES